MQQSFFEDNKKAGAILSITTQKKPLTKNQQSFNRLTARITTLRIEIEQVGDRLSKLSTVYNEEIGPAIKKLALAKIALAKILSAKYKTIKLTEKQREEVEYTIFDLLDDAFTVIPPDAEAQKIYENVSEVSYDQIINEQKQDRKEDLQDELYDLFGIDVDMGDFDDTPEGYTKFQEKIKAEIERQKLKKNSKKKTKKQLEKEARLLQEEEIKKRSIRSIYMSLAKLLHPDMEIDEAAKKEKEEIMKEVTKAYNENDLSSLLKLELRWVAKESDHLEKLTEDKLKTYVAVLKEQVKELEMEKVMQLNNPVFQTVMPLLKLSESQSFNVIKNKQREYNFHTEQVKKHTDALEGGKLRAAIRACTEAFYFDNDNGDDDNDDISLDEMMELLLKKGPFKR
jgi:hypothetical protein